MYTVNTMKILFVNRYASEAGGVECYINALAGRLRRAGHGTGIIHWDEPEKAERFGESYRVDALWENELGLGRKTEAALDEILKGFSPDVVYLHNIENGGAVDYFSARVRTVRYIHGYKTVDPDGKMLLRDPLEVNNYPLSPACFLRAYTRRSMPRSPVKAVKAYLRTKNSLEAGRRLEKVIVASGHMKKTLIRNGVRPERISILPYFVDYDEKPVDIPTGGDHILFAGRIADGKGLDMLLDVLMHVKKDFILDVAGAGPMEEICRKKAGTPGLAGKVMFHGWTRHEDLPEFYRKSLFLVLPSVWPEPFGICGIEAAFFGKPAVAFDVGGIAEWLVADGTGFLVKPYNMEEMAEKICYLLDNPKKALELGGKARELAVERYNPDIHISELIKIFKT